MKVKIIKDQCIGCGSCVAVEPDLFEIDDDMKSKFIGDIDKVSLEKLIEVAEICPVLAIEVYDDNGKKVYPKE
ncbi:ferredoxin [Patescibacteria group bacterium]|nr:ferredoxin [Patescibacteria group bacterium]